MKTLFWFVVVGLMLAAMSVFAILNYDGFHNQTTTIFKLGGTDYYVHETEVIDYEFKVDTRIELRVTITRKTGLPVNAQLIQTRDKGDIIANGGIYGQRWEDIESKVSSEWFVADPYDSFSVQLNVSDNFNLDPRETAFTDITIDRRSAKPEWITAAQKKLSSFTQE